jgi:hypothetical protein
MVNSDISFERNASSSFDVPDSIQGDRYVTSNRSKRARNGSICAYGNWTDWRYEYPAIDVRVMTSLKLFYMAII